ncbi:MAG: ISC system 2Fe-2S type ferredoxin [Gammaproteobacteria bacterium]
MPNIKIMPHKELCPDGAELSGATGTTICDLLLSQDIEIEHACEKSCACTTCHVVVRQGGESLNEAAEEEEDMLDKAWGLEPDSRLSCQAVIGDADLVVELPRYTVNLAREHH